MPNSLLARDLSSRVPSGLGEVEALLYVLKADIKAD